MPPYILDYADAPPKSAGPGTKPAAKPRLLVTAGFLIVFCVSLAGNVFYLSRQQTVRQAADRQALQYDSLLSAKLYADRQLADLRDHLTRLQRQHQRLQAQLRLQTKTP